MKKLLTFAGWVSVVIVIMVAALYLLKSQSENRSYNTVPISQRSAGNFDASMIVENNVDENLLNKLGYLTDEYYYYFPNSKYSVRVSIMHKPYLSYETTKVMVDYAIENAVKQVESKLTRPIFANGTSQLEQAEDTSSFMRYFKEGLNNKVFVEGDVIVNYEIAGFKKID